jgi:thymidylate synthase
MNNVDKQYLDMLRYILDNGEVKGDRTGTGTISVFDYTMTFDMSEGFPLLTSKKVFTKGIIHELIWFLRGETNIKYLVDNGVNIWNGDAYKNYLSKRTTSNKDNARESHTLKNGMTGQISRPFTQEEFINKIKTDDEFAKKWGELGPVYGKQWRNWSGYEKVAAGWEHGAVSYHRLVKRDDQISDLIHNLRNNPDSRRLLVSAWNVGELDEMVLPPCHFGFQCYTSVMSFEERKKRWCESISKDISYADNVTEEFLNIKNFPKRKLSLKWFQRSVDTPLGLPFNIASYAMLLHLLSKESNMIPHLLKFNGGDCHIYLNQVEGVKEQLESQTYNLPNLVLNNNSIDELKYEDIVIKGYDERVRNIKFPLSN